MSSSSSSSAQNGINGYHSSNGIHKETADECKNNGFVRFQGLRKLMNGRSKANGAVNNESFKKFIYNREKGTFLGRTFKSWVQVLGFYSIFYTLLMAFWVACLSAFLGTLDTAVPRYYGKGTIIGINPGVGYQPWLIDDPDSTLIRFNVREQSSYKKYVDTLNNYLSKYKNSTATRLCAGDESNSQLLSVGGAKAENLPGHQIVKSCRFDLNQFINGGCSQNNHYGFPDGKPCVVLSLNRLIGWKPVDYAPDSVPEEIKNRYRPNFVAFNCDGTSDFDKEHIGNVTYIPESGIDGKYYPYTVMPNYHQPIAMIKFDNLPRNKLVLVECRAFAQNIEFDITSKLGMVNFEVFIEDIVREQPAEKNR